MSWIDLLAVLLLASLIAFGAQRRLTGLLVGVGGALALRPLLLLGERNPWLAVVVGLGVGLALGLIGRQLLPGTRKGLVWQHLAGGVGGGALGLALVLGAATALPVQRSPFDPNQLFYPPRDLHPLVQGAALRSYTLTVGRDVLLYPLLEAQGTVPEDRRALLRGLNRWLVVGEPWRETGG